MFTLGRPLNWRYASNRFVLTVAAATFLLNLAWNSITLSTGVTLERALVASLSVVAAWAITRELDPDDEDSADVAAVLTAVLAFFVVHWEITMSFVLILATRLLTRSVGTAPNVFDIGLFTLLTLLGMTRSTPLLGLAVVAMLVLDVLFFDHKRYQARAAAAFLIFLVSMGTLLTAPLTLMLRWPPGFQFWSGTAIVVSYLVTTLPTIRTVKSVADRSKQKLQPRRIQAAVLWAVFTACVISSVGVLPLILWLSFVASTVAMGIKHVRQTWKTAH